MPLRTNLLAFALLGILAVAQSAPAQDVDAVAAQIDSLLMKSWRDAEVEPSPRTTDGAFLRRLSLDLNGVIPTVAETRTFLADESPDRRERLIDEMLGSPLHARHLARTWREVMLPSSLNEQFRLGGAATFELWLERHFTANTPYDAIVRELLETNAMISDVGPGLFYVALEFKPEELAASASRTFLGVQIQCAQCHDHPFDHWTQEDFWSTAAFFAQVAQPMEQSFPQQVVDTGRGEVMIPETATVVLPRFLDGTTTDSAAVAGTRRQQFARWVVAPENPFFAQATVNRVWAHLFGRGLVDPVDDLGDHNPPSQPEVLDLLAADLVEHDFNLRRLFQILARTDAYQLSSAGANWRSTELFAAMSVKSLSADQIYDCLLRATNRSRDAEGPAARQAFVAKFEAPTQGATEFEGGIPQALAMLNGPLVADATHWHKSDLLAAVADSPFLDDAQRVEVLYLATLSRTPSDAEQTELSRYLSEGDDTDARRRLADVLWALLNSSEFLLNH